LEEVGVVDDVVAAAVEGGVADGGGWVVELGGGSVPGVTVSVGMVTMGSVVVVVVVVDDVVVEEVSEGGGQLPDNWSRGEHSCCAPAVPSGASRPATTRATSAAHNSTRRGARRREGPTLSSTHRLLTLRTFSVTAT